MNQRYGRRELLSALYEDLGKMVTASCHELYDKSVNWCLEHGVSTSKLELVISKSLLKMKIEAIEKVTPEKNLVSESSDYIDAYYEMLFKAPPNEFDLLYLLDVPLLFSRGEWTHNYRQLLIHDMNPTITPRISFDSIDEAQEHGFAGHIDPL